MVRELIARHKNLLRATYITSALVAVGLILTAKINGGGDLEKWKFNILVVSAMLFCCANLLLLFEDWFSPSRVGVLFSVLRIFFYILVVASIVVFVGLLWFFVF